MSQEIELKLALPRKALPALRRHPLIAGAAKQGNAVTLDNTYFDTSDLSLKARKIAVRIRRQGRIALQTVKCAAESTAGLTQRPEWEQGYTGSFDFSAVDAPRVRKLLGRHAADLQPVFTTRFRRETRLYAPDDTVQILIMIDTGNVIAGALSEPICELELELVTGRPLDLLLLACQLAAELPVRPSDLSKAERGYRLHLGEPHRPQRAEPSAIDASQTPVAAFRTLAFACLRQWQSNIAGADAASDPEFIHQLRVALRRLRSLLELFGPALPADFVASWSERFTRTASAFADARDLDVMCEEIIAPAVGATTAGIESTALALLAERARNTRDQARELARISLDPAAHGRQLLELTTALHTLPTNNLIGAADLRTFASLQLDRLSKKVRRRHAIAADGTAQALHALRIALKRLRYALEFCAPLLATGANRRYLAAVIRALDALGYIHDADVGRARLTRWAEETPELRAAAAFVCGWHGPRYARLSRRVLRDLKKLLATRPWRA